MASKENKGGELTNEQLEKDLKVKGTTEQPGGYHGTQDTGVSPDSTNMSKGKNDDEASKTP